MVIPTEIQLVNSNVASPKVSERHQFTDVKLTSFVHFRCVLSVRISRARRLGELRCNLGRGKRMASAASDGTVQVYNVLLFPDR
jgi:hypothetical protein